MILRREFQPSRLGAALVVMISLASGVWTLLSDDLSLVIFGQSTIMNNLSWPVKVVEYVMFDKLYHVRCLHFLWRDSLRPFGEVTGYS